MMNSRIRGCRLSFCDLVSFLLLGGREAQNIGLICSHLNQNGFSSLVDVDNYKNWKDNCPDRRTEDVSLVADDTSTVITISLIYPDRLAVDASSDTLSGQ